MNAEGQRETRMSEPKSEKGFPWNHFDQFEYRKKDPAEKIPPIQSIFCDGNGIIFGRTTQTVTIQDEWIGISPTKQLTDLRRRDIERNHPIRPCLQKAGRLLAFQTDRLRFIAGIVLRSSLLGFLTQTNIEELNHQ